MRAYFLHWALFCIQGTEESSPRFGDLEQSLEFLCWRLGWCIVISFLFICCAISVTKTRGPSYFIMHWLCWFACGEGKNVEKFLGVFRDMRMLPLGCEKLC